MALGGAFLWHGRDLGLIAWGIFAIVAGGWALLYGAIWGMDPNVAGGGLALSPKRTLFNRDLDKPDPSKAPQTQAAVPQPETTRAARKPSFLQRAIWTTAGAVIATIAGLVIVIIVGMLHWNAVRGFTGVVIGAIVGTFVSALLRGFGGRLARCLAGTAGGAVAGFFAVAAGETSKPGSGEWAFSASLLGAVGGVAFAAIAAVAGTLVGASLTSVGRAFRRKKAGGGAMSSN